ncbi:MAG: DNA cytosine methyltransferase, partial [Gammaproteobacteria bacterium]|nr:DNA cytosine methyltransferase [Gammaproteobacteria bacterium]
MGGLDLGIKIARPRSRIICAVERDAYAAAVLLARMESADLEPAPVWCGNLESFDGRPWRGSVDLVTASPPCQPYSVAGAQRGNDDHRSHGGGGG